MSTCFLCPICWLTTFSNKRTKGEENLWDLLDPFLEQMRTIFDIFMKLQIDFGSISEPFWFILKLLKLILDPFLDKRGLFLLSLSPFLVPFKFKSNWMAASWQINFEFVNWYVGKKWSCRKKVRRQNIFNPKPPFPLDFFCIEWPRMLM